jgi:two-component system response regulator ResD
MNTHILIVDDEKEMRQLLKVCIKPLGYELSEASNGKEALDRIKHQQFDLVVLDIMMPEISGYEVLKEIREEMEEMVPIILLTALGETDKIVEGLHIGADDYIVKPFEPRELIARIKSILRRANVHEKSWNQEVYANYGLHVDKGKLLVAYNGKSVPLTKKEFNLLFRMIQHPGKVYSREHLLELEWGYDFEGDERTVDAHIKNIRDKLKVAGYSNQLIETVWGIGYKVNG